MQLHDANKCIGCGICVKVCPARALVSDKNNRPRPSESFRTDCIRCFHCVVYCTKHAFAHPDYPAGEQQTYDASRCAGRENMYALLASRRSVRSYRDGFLPAEEIAELMEATAFAPTGNNNQDVSYLIVQDRKIRDAFLTEFQRYLKGDIDQRHRLPYAASLLARLESGEDVLFRGSSQWIIALQPKNTLSKCDGVIALTYFELYARARGLGACWSGFAKDALNACQELRLLLGVEQDKACMGLMTFGMPRYQTNGIVAKRKKPVFAILNNGKG